MSVSSKILKFRARLIKTLSIIATWNKSGNAGPVLQMGRLSVSALLVSDPYGVIARVRIQDYSMARKWLVNLV